MFGDRKKHVVELLVMGEVQSLRLQPGDKLVVKFPDESAALSHDFYQKVKDEAAVLFPDNEIIVTCGIDLQVVTA